MTLDYFLSKLAKPFLQFANGVWDLFVKMDKWWSAKSEFTKLHLKYMFFIGLGLSERIESGFKYENKIVVLERRITVNRNISDKKEASHYQWKYDHLEEDIQKINKAKEIAEKNEEDILKLLKKK